MKNQYFGDRRDFFKYELLLDLVHCLPEPRLVSIPLLTPSDGTNEGRVTAYDCGARRRVLFDQLRAAVDSGTRDIRALRDVLPRCGAQFFPYRDAEYFHDETRQEYFDAVPSDWLARAVIFFDPDIGLQVGTLAYMRRNGTAKYLMYADLSCIFAKATEDSAIVVYQHRRYSGSRPRPSPTLARM